MLKILFQNTWLKKTAYALSAGMLLLAMPHSVYAEPAQNPLFLTAPVKPLMMLNMSKDHQLYFKAYDDYTDLDPEADDGIELTYKHTYDYYGYFDSKKCYKYQNSRFEPIIAVSADGLCNVVAGSKEWSGNFLNWATMTRMDAVRKILYGGLRIKANDTATETVLERSFLPHDAHSFAKYYNGPIAISSLTPADTSLPQGLLGTQATGITICNTTNGSGFSQGVTNPPLIRVAKGNHSLWASNERWQCRWSEDISTGNGNDPAKTGIYASANNPTKSSVGLEVDSVSGDFNARVKVCVPGLLEQNCRVYPNGNHKPAGLLQRYGEPNDISFGLITGSYVKNKSGGVLRKNIGGMANEINITTDGTFKTAPAAGGIINTLNLLRIFGYDYGNGEYSSSGSGDNCSFGLSSFSDGRCTNWGNPQAEIFLESLRYFAGAGKLDTFDADDSTKIVGLKTAAWADPLSNENYCAPLSVIQFNASTVSYDSEVAGGEVTFSGLSTINETNALGVLEALTGTYFVGENGVASESNQLCTAKAVSNLASVRGTCPDAPRLEGSYLLAGLAKYARSNDIRSGLTGAQRVQTYGVALSPAVPAVTVPVPGSNTKKITILPACQNAGEDKSSNPIPEGNCAIVDFKIIEYTHDSSTNNTGKLYVNWEAAEQGGDYDQDMWGLIEYSVTASTVSVTTQVMQQSSGRKLGFGYVISGTETDGFKVHSGIQNYTYGTSCTLVDGNRCTCRAGTDSGHAACDLPLAAARTGTYIVKNTASNSEFLQPPLYYAAKWGGYSETFEKATLLAGANLDATVRARDPSDSYFYATDPRHLEASLESAFKRVAERTGTASAVSTSSTRLTTDSSVYQALFNSTDWSGELKILRLTNGELAPTIPSVTTDTSTFAPADTRKIYTYSDKDDNGVRETVEFRWDNLEPGQKEDLKSNGSEAASTDAVGQDRLNWIRGDTSKENAVGGMRVRTKLIGDIVNSSPVYSGNKNARYLHLPGSAGTDYATYTKDKIVYVGANDGMLHAFDATNLNELFAYIPTGVYPKLANITKPNYGMHGNSHQYLVDGSLTVADFYTGTEWKTVLVGTLGAGGKGIFALDVTNPAAPTVIFERGAADGVGYIMGEPIVAQLKNGSWVVVFGNGYENGNSQLFVVDLNDPDGEGSRVIDTAGGTGLSAVALLPNTLGQVEYAYAGELTGNMLKFNLTNDDPTDWTSEILFQVTYTDPNNQVHEQPITSAPTLGRNPLKNNVIMVYFGTGKYFDTADNTATAIPRQSFYAIADDGSSPFTFSRAVLHQKNIVQEDGATTRTINGERDTAEDGTVTSAVNWTSKRGWYVDFDTVNGERVITKPLLAFDRLIFTTLVPSAVPCSYGGTSWLMELVAIGNKNITHSILGESANTELDSAVLGEMSVGIDGDKLKLIPCDITGDCDLLEGELKGGTRGRLSWRQLR